MNLRLARYIDRWVGLAICFVLLARGAGRGLVVRPDASCRRCWRPRPRDPHDAAAPPRRVLGDQVLRARQHRDDPARRCSAARERRSPAAEIDFLTLPRQRRACCARAGWCATCSRSRSALRARSRARRRRSRPRCAAPLRRGARLRAVREAVQHPRRSSPAPERESASTPTARGAAGSTRTASSTPTPTTCRTSSCAPRARSAGPICRRRRSRPRGRPRHERRVAREAGVAADRFPLVAMHVGHGTNYDKIALKRWDSDASRRSPTISPRAAARRIVFTGRGRGGGALVDEALARDARAARRGVGLRPLSVYPRSSRCSNAATSWCPTTRR